MRIKRLILSMSRGGGGGGVPVNPNHPASINMIDVGI